MEAQIRIHNAGFKHISAAVVLLALLLTVFFWLGFWTAGLNISGGQEPRVVHGIPLPPEPEDEVPAIPKQGDGVRPVDPPKASSSEIVRL